VVLELENVLKLVNILGDVLRIEIVLDALPHIFRQSIYVDSSHLELLLMAVVRYFNARDYLVQVNLQGD
jgi:hypothetical protein